MERTKYKIPDAILTSDWHLREDTPTCWIGDFQMEQWLAVATIAQLQEKYNCPVIHAGDLFHHWKPSPWLLTQAFDLMPKEFYTIYGQHDLPQHNWELRGKSGIKTLAVAKRLTVLEGCHYGQEPKKPTSQIKGKNILVWHKLVYHKKKPYPDAPSTGSATSVIRYHPEYDLIVTGDNHVSFEVGYEGQLLVNPGPITRQAADQIDHKPCVFLWYAETNTVEQVFLPIEDGVVTREHIEIKQERDARIDAFISRLNTDYEATLSFEDNLEIFFQTNETDTETKQIIYKCLE